MLGVDISGRVADARRLQTCGRRREKRVEHNWLKKKIAEERRCFVQHLSKKKKKKRLRGADAD